MRTASIARGTFDNQLMARATEPHGNNIIYFVVGVGAGPTTECRGRLDDFVHISFCERAFLGTYHLAID